MTLSSKFKGCLLGGLIGDCIGAPFEGERRAVLSVLHNYFSGLADPNKRLPYKAYTDDTAMTNCVASSLIECQKLDSVDMAQRFVEEYYTSPGRGYGSNVIEVFRKLRALDFKDVFLPSKLQFGGRGSYGNGGAMRVAPIALFNFHSPIGNMIEMAAEGSKITHSNRLGYNGAVLQCLAVYYALQISTEEFDETKFINDLSKCMKEVEKFKSDEIKDAGIEEFVYVAALEKVLELLEKKNDVAVHEVDALLGTDISAHRSVPTAIYAFLRSRYPITHIKAENEFERTIMYAISLGGDTDTIASMAGHIAGAFYGRQNIPAYLLKHCEHADFMADLAEKLYALVSMKN